MPESTDSPPRGVFTVELRVHVAQAMLEELDRACREIGVSRAALTRILLRDFLRTRVAAID